MEDISPPVYAVRLHQINRLALQYGTKQVGNFPGSYQHFQR